MAPRSISDTINICCCILHLSVHFDCINKSSYINSVYFAGTFLFLLVYSILMCFLSTWNGNKKTLNKQGKRAVSHGWIEITSELNVNADELSLNFWIMRNYVHGNQCRWLRNSYNWEGCCWDEIPVCLPLRSHYMPAFTSDRCYFSKEKTH